MERSLTEDKSSSGCCCRDSRLVGNDGDSAAFGVSLLLLMLRARGLLEDS